MMSEAAERMLSREDAQAAEQRAELFHALGTLAAAQRDAAEARLAEKEQHIRELKRHHDAACTCMDSADQILGLAQKDGE